MPVALVLFSHLTSWPMDNILQLDEDNALVASDDEDESSQSSSSSSDGSEREGIPLKSGSFDT